jgi:hypothetical protein
MTVYLSMTAWEVVEDARAAIDLHSKVWISGHCAECGRPEPCEQRQRAHATLERYQQLPKRTPGNAGVVNRRSETHPGAVRL